MPLNRLAQLSTEEFLRDYWQQKPVLLRQALPNFQDLIDADELAGLSLEDESQSRLIIQEPDVNHWQLKHGPLHESDFSQLPTSHWTLLVQHVDALNHSVNTLLDLFRFIPNWRLDDIMVSYASDGGSVGPHFDYYDVFLLQGQGRKRWRLGQHCNHKSALVPDQAMKILADFETIEDWIVEPGDLLYIPAHVAHWGEAIGSAITYSIGFRAPSLAETLLDLGEELSADLNDDQRYRDPPLCPTQSPGLIDTDCVDALRQSLHDLLDQPGAIADWLASYSTKLKPSIHAQLLEQDEADMSDWRENTPLQLSPFCRSAFHTEVCSDDGEQARCFINGDCWAVTRHLAEKVTSGQVFSHSELSAKDRDTVEQWIRLGHLNRAINH